MRRNTTAILLILLFFIELLALHLVNGYLYNGVIKIWLFDLIMIPLLLGVGFIKRFDKRKTTGFVTLFVITLILFIMILPSITYENGKAIVQKEMNREAEAAAFISTDYRLIPTASSKSWFIKDYYYHYEVEASGERLFYVVSPVNGSSFQLEEDFFRYDR
ncbi:hypothetical protein [Paenibacillus xylaniclasticus]|uniref:hypothetical protein n=1 Tax=Paenibacillus xylaniclasticus TaxID=588083 RepID=UPI000FD7CF68|nr:MULTISPECIES: hypothetical protein [Paenibacillus]GFN33496.1 hypothetical protein PCURB6_37560 [Paenibacillus curdlanolyticus]